MYKYAKSGYSLAYKTRDAVLRGSAQLRKETETLKNICQEIVLYPLKG